MEGKEVFLKEDIVWAFEAFIGLLKDSEAINPQTIRVVEQLKSQIVGIVPTHEIGSFWHTGTPTEEGWYLVAFNYEDEEGVRYTTDYFKDGKWAFPMVRDISKVVKWQKIEEN